MRRAIVSRIRSTRFVPPRRKFAPGRDPRVSAAFRSVARSYRNGVIASSRVQRFPRDRMRRFRVASTMPPQRWRFPLIRSLLVKLDLVDSKSVVT